MLLELMVGDYVFCIVNGVLSDYLFLEFIVIFCELEGLMLVLEVEKV